MKMIIMEVVESLKRKKMFSMLIILQIVIFFAVVTTLFLQYSNIEKKSGQVNSLKAMNDYQLSDTLIEDSDMKEFTNNPKFLVIAKTFYNNLNKILDDKYIYLFNQSIAVLPDSKEWDPKFLFGYEDGRDNPAFRLNNKEPYYATKAVQMNEQAFKNYSIEVDKGTPFSTDDFVNKNNKEIPILLGSEYEEKYDIGDRITANYLMKDFTLIVKGFVQSNTLVYNSQFPEMYLDRYIVMPAQEFPSPVNEDEFSFQKKHYLQLINGHIFSPENEYVVQNKLEEIKDISDFHKTGILGANKLPLSFIFSTLQVNKSWLSLITAVIFVVCVLSISILIITKLQNQLKNISVHLISGASMNQLLSYYVAEVISIILLPGILFLIFYKFFVGLLLSSYFLLILSCIIGMVLFSVIPILIQFRKLEISKLLKRTE
ncbi:ABC transporter permease [Paenibacillus peoriae]|uniref:ABC transporter permease n=1 Tax=Paenibacillus peoriae TaxID=59893 RepID=A0A7H0Y2D6_9BACL|nr:ABC transporter permease [Paenibacillus peoriae]QNR65244.1 ABC transporter permease [Paenibacillus peoriae]